MENSMDTSKEYGALKNWEIGKFVPVVDVATGKAYYGGYQNWLMDEGVSQFYADRSCGVTAITNMLVYMAQNMPDKANLLSTTVKQSMDAGIITIKKSDYSALQKSVYKQIIPVVWGVPTIHTIVERVQNFALKRGVKLKAVKNSKTWSEPNIRDFIARGLNKNCPVLLLTWNTSITDLNLHWVTITRLFETETGTKMVTSNWGHKQIFDFSAWVNGPSLHKGLVYFE